MTLKNGKNSGRKWREGKKETRRNENFVKL